MQKKTQKQGFMMIEILVAISIIAIFVLTAMTVAQKSVYLSRQALHSTQAAFLLEEGAEKARIARDNDWNNLNTLDVSEEVGIFNRTIFTTEVERNTSTGDIGSGTLDPGTKLITVTVAWPEGGETITKTLQFYIMDIFS